MAWANRGQPGQTERAIHLWQDAQQKNASSADLAIKLTKACGRAMRHAETKAERQRWADLAKGYGAQAVALAPNQAETYTAYGEALAQWARAHKGLHSLGSVRQAVEVLEKSIALNPHQPFAHMLLAEIYLHAPGRPISVGDKTKGLEQAKMGAAQPGAYAINHLVLARAYLDHGQKEEAKKELHVILQLKPPADAIPETQADQETAREMMRKL